jgi:hypothetical protein
MPCMSLVLGLTDHTGIRLAEVGFLLIAFAGFWFAAADIAWFRLGKTRSIIAGMALASGAVLLIIATHWGHFG